MARGIQPQEQGMSPDAERQRQEEMIFQAAQNGTLDQNSAAYRHAKLMGWVGGGNSPNTNTVPEFFAERPVAKEGERRGDAGWNEQADVNAGMNEGWGGARPMPGETAGTSWGGIAEMQNADKVLAANEEAGRGQIDMVSQARQVGENDLRQQNDAQKLKWDGIMSTLRLSMDGQMSPKVRAFMNRSMGYGNDKGIVDSGFKQDGSFSMRLARNVGKGERLGEDWKLSPDGKIAIKNVNIDAEDVLSMMSSSLLFTEKDISEQKARLLNNGYSSKEVDRFANALNGIQGMYDRSGVQNANSTVNGSRGYDVVGAMGHYPEGMSMEQAEKLARSVDDARYQSAISAIGQARNDATNRAIDKWALKTAQSQLGSEAYLMSPRGKWAETFSAQNQGSRPSGPKAGGTNVTSWFSENLRPGRISAFSSDGKGGFSRTGWDGSQYVTINKGTRADDYQGEWKTLRSGFISRGVDANGQSMGDYGSVMQNSKTGEIKFVPQGGALTKEQQAQESRLELQQLQNEGAVDAAEARSHNWDGKNNTATQQVLGKMYDTILRQISNATDPKVKEDLQGQLESIRAAMTESGIKFGDGSAVGTAQPGQKTGKSIVENALAGKNAQQQQNPPNASKTPISEDWVDFYAPDGKKYRAKGYVKNGVAYGSDGKELGRTTNKPAAGGKTTPPPNKKEAVDPKNESAGDFSISKSARKLYKDDNRERAFKKFYQELVSKEGMEDIPESAARERFDSYLERRKDPEGTVMKILDNGIEALGGTLDAMGKGIFGIGRK